MTYFGDRLASAIEKWVEMGKIDVDGLKEVDEVIEKVKK
jgi:hypothetical protein